MTSRLLIASPQMKDPFFERTVVLVWHHDEQGAIGVVINRSLPHQLSDVLMLQEAADFAPHPDTHVSWGGPVETTSGTVIIRDPVEGPDGWNVAQGISITRSEDVLFRLIREHKQLILCLGYAGWGPGQLDAEVAAGGWLFTDATPDLIFDAPADECYDRALSTLGLTPEMVWMQPVSEC